MKIWITKYALTQGIIEKDNAEICTEIDPHMVSVPWENCLNGKCTFHKGDWFTDHVDAVLEATRLKYNRIKSLKKQIAKLEKLNFE